MRFDKAALALVFVLGTNQLGQAQELDRENYLLPPESVKSLLDRSDHFDQLQLLGPDGAHFLVPVQEDFSTLELMAQKTYRLAMLELVPHANREWRLSTYGTRSLKIYSLPERRFWEIRTPSEGFVSDMIWSPDGSRLAFLAHLPQGTQVWTADVKSGEAGPLSARPVMATLAARPGWGRNREASSRLLQWTPEGSVLTLLVPEQRGPEPAPPAIPPGPLVRKTREKATPTRTYPFLLRTPYDEALFRYYTTSQLALLSQGQPPRPIGEPAMYLEFSLSPDGRYILAEKLVEPFSYIVDYNGFPRELVVMDLEGKVLSTIRKRPLREALRRRGAPDPDEDLPREVAWRPDGKGLSFLWREPRKEGEGDEPAEGQEESEQERGARQDRLMLLEPPFDLTQAQVLVSDRKTFSNVVYSLDGRWVFATLRGRGEENRSRQDLVAYDLSSPERTQYFLAKGIDPRDILKLPGELVLRRSGNGLAYALLTSDGEAVYLQGEGYQEDFRHRPFLDRVSIRSGEKSRIFEGASDAFEEPLVVLDPEAERLVISRESPTDFPDSFLWSRDGTRQQLTQNQNPFPEVADCRRIHFEFTRRDGLTIYGRLALPVGYREGERVPAVFWTYPREYSSFREYKRAALRSHNRNAFPRFNYRNASDIWLTQGYAVVEPDIPIVGEGNRYNDNYIAHLVDSMYAAIREVDRMGFVDVDRLGHGGHSYGAFATANILAHTPFFKAGIAGDGAYNRTLTPMTFQNERRFLWEAQHTILEMSPFFYADHLDTPLLMYHGAEDNNTGTFLIQSERMLQALTGLGKTAVLYIYPFESHGPRARETYYDLWARWLAWFDRYVKGEKKEEEALPTEQQGEGRASS